MSNRDHEPKLPEERLGTYTPHARLGPDAGEGGNGGVEGAEARSWAARAEDDARPQSFSGAAVTPYGQLVEGASDQVGGGFGGSNTGGYGQQGLGSQWGQAGFGPLTQGINYSTGGGAFGPAGFAPYPEGPGARGPRQGSAYGEPRGGAYERPSLRRGIPNLAQRPPQRLHPSLRRLARSEDDRGCASARRHRRPQRGAWG